MTDARLRLFWHRAGPMTVALGTLAVAAAQGCGGGSSTNTGGTGGTTTTTTGSMTTTTTTTTGTGGTGGTGTTTTTTTGTGGTSTMLTPTLAANQVSPFDATPDATGENLFFTGLSNAAGAQPLAGVYTAPANGMMAAPTAVLAGAPYVAPYGIATSTDGKTLYVADPGADITLDANGNQIKGAGTDLGSIFIQSTTAGMAPTVLAGSAGYDPRNLEVNSEGTPAADVVYFTGVDATNGKPGVFKVAAAGATTPTTVFEGAPFVDPSGIAIGSDGTIYVADTLGATGGQIIAIPKGTTTPGTPATFEGNLRIGYPAGVAVSKDGTSLLVSTLDPAKATDAILEFTIATPTMAPTTISIAAGTEAAGLHRAKAAEVFAFADGTVGAMGATGATAAVRGGGVYTVK
jgi:sugar lactone lactonase YvrE